MKALVTGANGFLGKYIVEQLLQSGWQVRTLTRNTDADLQKLGVEMQVGDIRNEDKVVAACREIDTVFHAAGIAGIWGPWKHFHGVNTIGTKNVLQGCLRHGVRNLVYTSSPSVVFAGQAHSGVDESVPYPSKWLGHYSHSKALAEQAVLQANGQRGLLTCALRPHLIWGPRDRHLIPRLLSRAKSGRLRQVGDGTNRVDNVYVENAADAHLLADQALAKNPDSRGRAYFISQGEPVNCWDWINQILQLGGLPPLDKKISYPLAYAAGAISEFAYSVLRRQSEPLMTRFLAAQLAKSHYFDISAARDVLGYQPRISFDEGMSRLKIWLESSAS